MPVPGGARRRRVAGVTDEGGRARQSPSAIGQGTRQRSPVSAGAVPDGLEHHLHRLGVTQKNSRPNHPTTCGKVERFPQTLKNWLRAQPAQPADIGQLQALIEAFVDEYNHRRPHRSLPRHATPATA